MGSVKEIIFKIILAGPLIKIVLEWLTTVHPANPVILAICRFVVW
jgi:hypothetical protein